MLASALDKVVTFAGEVVFEMTPPTAIKPEATPGEQIDLRMSGQSAIPPYTRRKRRKHISYVQLDDTSLEFSKQIGDDYRLDQELRTGKHRNSRLLSCITS